MFLDRLQEVGSPFGGGSDEAKIERESKSVKFQRREGSESIRQASYESVCIPWLNAEILKLGPGSSDGAK